MSNTIDRRIVEMQFDNEDFERNVKDSVKSLDKLKESLDLEESAKGLMSLEKAGRKFSLDGIAQAAAAVTHKFSVLGVIGDQILRRIGDAAFNAMNKMKNFIDSLTIQPIYTGFQEYETQIDAIQTILSNTRDAMVKQGYSDAERLEIVNDRLDQLNHYADKTIYNFTEMTRNIGTFTAAGVELDTAVESIQGIANLAAVSGSTSEQASRAMYQLSQAISTGTVRLMDWNSVVNAGMGGELFQKALKRTAKAMGKTIDESKSFRDSLADGWLTADVLTATLEQFSWDFEQMAEDALMQGRDKDSLIKELADMYIGQGEDADKALEKAKELLDNTEDFALEAAKELKKGELLAMGYTPEEAEEIIQLAQDATDAATKVKTFTQLFDTLKEAAQSGWTQTWEYIIGDFEQAKEMLTGISDFFGKIIEDSADARNEIFKEWTEQGGRDTIWNGDPEKGPLGAFWNLAYGIKNIVGMVKEEFRKIFPSATGQTLLNFTQKIQQVTANFKAWTENSDGMEKIRRIVAGIAAAFDIWKTAIGYVWQGFKKLISFSGPASGGILEFAASIGDWLVKAKDAVKSSEGFQRFLNSIGAIISKVKDITVSAFKTVSGWIGKLWGKLKSSGIFTKIGNGINDFVGKIPGAIDKVKQWVSGIIEYVKASGMLQKVWDNVKKFFGPVISRIGDFGKRLKEGLSKFFSEDVSGEEGLWGKLKARLLAFGSAFSDWFETVKETVTIVWNNIKAFLTNFFTKTIPDFFNSSKVATSGLIAKIKSIDWVSIIKTAAGIYTGLKVLSALSAIGSVGKGLKKIGNGLKAMGQGIKDVVKNGVTITKHKDSLGNTLLKIAAAIGVVVASIYVLSKMDTEDVVKGLGVISFIAIELLAVSFLFGKIGADGKSFLKVAVALALLVIPIKLLGSMDAEQALKGIFAIGVIMAEMGLFMRLAGKGFTGKTGFLGLSIAINLMVLAVKNLANLDTGSMIKSLIGMEFLLLEISSFMKKTSSLGKVGGLIGMAIAINLLVFAVKRMGKMDGKTIAKGVLGLGGIMLAFGVMAKMTKGMKLGSSIVTLLTMAGTLFLFIEAFKQVENANMDDMLKFATSISEVMLALSIAMKVISTIPISGALTGLASFAILIAGIGLIVVALGALQNEWAGMTGFLEGGGDVLGLIGRALGKFVGGIAGGIVEGLNLPQIGTDLSSFMTNASGFIEGAKNIDGSVVSGIGELCAALLAIGGTEFVTALITLFTGENPVTKFSADLATLGSGLKGYAEAISGFSDAATAEDLSMSSSVATSLSDLNNSLPSTGGTLQDWLGSKNLSKFSTDIVKLAAGLKMYALAINGFSSDATTEDLSMASSVAMGLSDLNNSLPSTGGTLQDWIGSKNLSKFSTDIVKLAAGLKTYAVAINGFSSAATAEDLSMASSVAMGLSDVNNSLPSTGGTLQDWLGSKNLGKFSTDIVKLAAGLKTYAVAIKGFANIATDEDLAKANSVANALSDLNTSLPNTGGGLSKWLFGEVNLGLFATNIGLLGNGLKTFADSVGNVSYEKSEDALSVIDLIKEFSGGLDNEGGLWSKIVTFFEGENEFVGLSEKMATVGANLATFANNISGADFSNAESATQMMTEIQTFIDGLDPTGGMWSDVKEWFGGSKDIVYLSEKMASFATNFSSFASGITGASEASANFAIVDGIISSFTAISSSVKEGGLKTSDIENVGKVLGSKFGSSIATAISGCTAEVKNASENLSSDGAYSAESTYGTWESAGLYLGYGLANGISAMAGSIRAAAVNAAAGATRAIQITWSVHSPSKVGHDLGMYFDLGIAGGLEAYSRVISDQARDVGKNAVDSASTMLRGVDGSIFDNIDPNPTIRPVIDLTNVQNGVSAINGMFNPDNMQAIGLFRGMNLSRGINHLNLDSGRINGVFTDKHIVDNLEGLKTKIEELGEAVTNMKLVLDTGVLVGETSSQMDNQLGTLAMRRGRGN